MKEIGGWYSLKRSKSYRRLTADEIAQLMAQGNCASDWGEISVAEGFDAARVRGCRFDGRVDIGAFTSDYLRYGYVTLSTGLYNSCFSKNTFIGDNAAIHNLLYSGSRDVYIGNSVFISNLGELSMSRYADFGMGDNRWINIINENGGRAILASPELTVTDALIWAKLRDDAELMERFAEITRKSNVRPWCAIVGNGAVIINTKAVRGSIVGPCAVIDGADLVFNSTVMSDKNEKTIIGSAVQIRNSIIGYGNSVDSASQLESVLTGTSVALTQAARVTHSVIGDNAHIACCEIANTLVAPSHAQHHNSSFLIAAMIGGQSNIAAGATIGSNHNSRVNDGEIWARRGFWPGLCVSLKHNSMFASFTMIAKGTYPAELNVRLPFSLVARDEKSGMTAIHPAFWFTRDMYAVMRGAQKFVKRDTRIHRGQFIEHDILAPDTVDEMFEAICLIESDEPLDMERGCPATPIKHANDACAAYRLMIRHYCAKNILPFMREKNLKSFDGLRNALYPLSDDGEIWLNIGSMVITKTALTEILDAIKTPAPPTKRVKTWSDVHALINVWTEAYKTEKIKHALQSLGRLNGVSAKDGMTHEIFTAFLKAVPDDCKKIVDLTRASRIKDFADPFRKMVYHWEGEMTAVLGEVDDAVVRQTIEEMGELSVTAIELYDKLSSPA